MAGDKQRYRMYCFRCRFLHINALKDVEGNYELQWVCTRHKKVTHKFGYCRYWRVAKIQDHRTEKFQKGDNDNEQDEP